LNINNFGADDVIRLGVEFLALEEQTPELAKRIRA
jgi:hypothetical protein